MVYTIYDGPRQLENGMWYWAYAAWNNVRDQQANRGAVVLHTGKKTINCDFAEDHFASFRTDHVRTVLDRDGNEKREEYTLSIEVQVEQAILTRLALAEARGERGNKSLPVNRTKPDEVEKYLERAHRIKSRRRSEGRK